MSSKIHKYPEHIERLTDLLSKQTYVVLLTNKERKQRTLRVEAYSAREALELSADIVRSDDYYSPIAHSSGAKLKVVKLLTAEEILESYES